MKTMICEEKIASRDERRVGRLIQEINKFYEFIIRNWTDEIRDTIIRPGDPQDFDSRENGFYRAVCLISDALTLLQVLNFTRSLRQVLVSEI